MIDNDWDRNERAVEAMIPLIGQMYREKTVEISVFGQLMVKRTVNDILKAHETVHQIEDLDLLPEDTLAIVEALSRMPLSHAHIDIGKMVVKYYKQGGGNTRQFLETELASAMTGDNDERRKKDVVLYGFGRIGRLLARLLCDRTGGGRGMRLAAIVVRRGKGNDLQKRASLLRLDSVHGAFDGVVNVDEEANELIINGQRVKVVYADAPETVDYAGLGIKNALVIDNTGVWRGSTFRGEVTVTSIGSG